MKNIRYYLQLLEKVQERFTSRQGLESLLLSNPSENEIDSYKRKTDCDSLRGLISRDNSLICNSKDLLHVEMHDYWEFNEPWEHDIVIKYSIMTTKKKLWIRGTKDCSDASERNAYAKSFMSWPSIKRLAHNPCDIIISYREEHNDWSYADQVWIYKN